MRKILLVVSSQDFKDEEYFTTKEVLEDEGYLVETASDTAETAFGSEGGEAEIDLQIEDVELQEYDALAFIGGQGALKHLDNKQSYRLARQALQTNKILGAICIAPVILAKAGVLRKKQATVWSSATDKTAIKLLKKHEAIFIDQPVVQDSKIITANGSAASQDFGLLIAKNLE
jgi:protease I